MWSRTVSLEVRPEGAVVRDEPDDSPPCRFRAALVHWPGAAVGSPAPAILAGIAWEGPSGRTLWGWPEAGGRIILRESSHDPATCSLAPPALSLSLALRRAPIDLGATVLVAGDGYLARLAAVVARRLGCRVHAVPGPEDAAPSPDPDVVVETEGDPGSLSRALGRCRDWGSVYSMGGGLGRAALDFYPDVHRRALSLHHVPIRPVLFPGDEEVLENGLPGMIHALRGLAPEAQETLEARILPEAGIGRLTREKSGRWGHLVVATP